MVLFRRVRLFLACVTSEASATAALLATLSPPPHVENNERLFHVWRVCSGGGSVAIITILSSAEIVTQHS